MNFIYIEDLKMYVNPRFVIHLCLGNDNAVLVEMEDGNLYVAGKFETEESALEHLHKMANGVTKAKVGAHMNIDIASDHGALADRDWETDE